MASKPKFYFETTVLMEVIERPAHDPMCVATYRILEAAENNKCEVFTSSLTMVEVLFAESEKKNGKPCSDTADKISALWHPDGSPIQIIPCHELITREALQHFRAHWKKDGWSKSKGIDLVHLVTAKREKVDKFFTTEGAMGKWASVMGFKVCRPEYDDPSPSSTPLFTEAKKA